MHILRKSEMILRVICFYVRGCTHQVSCAKPSLLRFLDKRSFSSLLINERMRALVETSSTEIRLSIAYDSIGLVLLFKRKRIYFTRLHLFRLYMTKLVIDVFDNLWTLVFCLIDQANAAKRNNEEQNDSDYQDCSNRDVSFLLYFSFLCCGDVLELSNKERLVNFVVLGAFNEVEFKDVLIFITLGKTVNSVNNLPLNRCVQYRSAHEFFN